MMDASLLFSVRGGVWPSWLAEVLERSSSTESRVVAVKDLVREAM